MFLNAKKIIFIYQFRNYRFSPVLFYFKLKLISNVVYSIVVQHDKKVLVGTDEGVVLTYNWNEFGSACDRFPVRTKRSRMGADSVRTIGEAGLPAVEKMIKITEDVVVIATDDGALRCVDFTTWPILCYYL